MGLRRLRHPLRHLPSRPAARATSSSASTTPPRCTASPARPARWRCTSPGTRSTTTARCAQYIEARGLSVGAVNPNLFQDPDYKLGSVTHPDARVREKAVGHLLECLGIAAELGSTAQSLWFADGTNYPGQDDLRERRQRLVDALGEPSTPSCRPTRSCSSSTSSSSRRSTPPTSPTGAPRCSSARSSASARACSSTSATTPRASTSSRSSPCSPTRAGSAASTSTTASTPTTT